MEIYKTPNKLNPEFMKDLFKLRVTNRLQREKYKLNLHILESNQVTFGSTNLHIQDPHVWNSLPYHKKSLDNLDIFKTVIKFWDRTTCSCNMCPF